MPTPRVLPDRNLTLAERQARTRAYRAMRMRLMELALEAIASGNLSAEDATTLAQKTIVAVKKKGAVKC